ncbi:DEAD/DEAH box helicase family protein [Streptomyces iconiensis]|uniref:DEAD/DEAH box helicase family protein n=1 Tax=Streptomyces iconiensis TaxID=1384038 RepID=A0ABT6ZWZ4_9ACTN|nr:DEAD/DEAH box helicase family protein [Streptomyces iconiensis]MDJ1133151.1 DEAD/DEAH box helicase family protein [Streptomyces iconiensis]
MAHGHEDPARGQADAARVHADLAATRPPVPLRGPQRAALDELERAFAAGRSRAWLVLPPGMGKTLTGLEAARRLGRRTVVLGPNTAIQEQWRREWAAFRPAPAPAGTDRSLAAQVTVLTYQSLATFDPEAEVAEEGGARRGSAGHLRRLRPQGRELVDRLRAAGDLTLLLDECHHLLDTWGELLAELLRELPGVTVVGLTATPPDRLTPVQARLVDELFGPAVRGPSLPAAVRDGHLAPYSELAWLTEPTPSEADWIGAEAERFTELTTQLLDPGFASVPFLAWHDARTVRRAHDKTDTRALPWHRFAREEPELAAAALRLHHHGLLALPEGARLREEHRRAPDAGDWVRLLDDWVRHCLSGSREPRDALAVEAVRAALPSVGYRLTARGISAGRSPVDRVLARSAAKTGAVREILGAEDAALGARLRAVVICDHERATATLPARLDGVLDEQAGSARLVLCELAADPRTAALSPLLVTGRTVAAARTTAERFVRYCQDAEPGLRLGLEPAGTTEAAKPEEREPEERVPGTARPEGGGPAAGSGWPAPDVVEVTGTWTSRRWVPLATRFLESGGTRALVGTRALLGEGWDARGVNTLVDLSEATTPTAVVQTRGRALRTDPDWPEKTAHTWSVVCVAEGHLRGNGDWDRFVRKHEGYLGITGTGAVMSGVAHVHQELSPYAPPPAHDFARLNALMLDRIGDGRAAVRELWRIGTPYEDDLVHTLRVLRTGPGAQAPVMGARGEQAAPPEPPAAVPGPRGLAPRPALGRTGAAATVAAALLAGPAGAPAAGTPGVAASAALAGWAAYTAARALTGARGLRKAAAEPVLSALAHSVADGLHAAGCLPEGAAAVQIEPDGAGGYGIRLDGVSQEHSERFAAALDEVISPVGDPRYLLPRYVVHARGLRAGHRITGRAAAADAVVHHAVPGVVGANRRLVEAYAGAWHRWVSVGEPVYTRSAEGAGILAAQAGRSPLDVTTALRVAWR